MIKKLKMKNLNLLFAGVLILLMYKTPSFLTDITTSIFGRAALVIILAYTLIYCDFSCSIFFALIIIVLFHNTLEGFKEGAGVDTIVDDGTEESSRTEEGLDEGEEEEEEEEEDGGKKKEEDSGKKKEEDFNNKEGFLGINMISKKVLNKNFIGNLTNSFKHNLTDLDRFLKTKSEKNTIGATKQ